VLSAKGRDTERAAQKESGLIAANGLIGERNRSTFLALDYK